MLCHASTAAELAEDPAFSGALQQVLRSFDALLASQRIGFAYAPCELRQACSFIVRHLDRHQKHLLAQDAEELFYVSWGVGGSELSGVGQAGHGRAGRGRRR